MELSDRFRLVEFQLNYVLSRTEPRKIICALNSLPHDLPEAYQDVFKRIERHGFDRKDLVVKIISWIYHCQRPLTMGELRDAIAVEPGDTDLDPNYLLEPAFIVEISESLISYDENSGIVRFSHFTVYEFLQTLEAPSLLSSIDIAKVCLTCLGFDDFESHCIDATSMGERLQKYRLCRYISEYWGFHIREAENHEEVQKAAISILASENKRNWVLTMKRYVMFGSGNMFDTRGQSLLHVLAKNGLSIICKLVLEARYVFVPLKSLN